MNRLNWFDGNPDFPSASQMTPEQRRQYVVGFDAAMPKLDHHSGTVVIFGTGGEFEKGNVRELFMSPDISGEGIEEQVGKLSRYFLAPVWRENGTEVGAVVADQVDEQDQQQDSPDHLDDRRRND